jgi:hypothetical protein
VANGLRLARRLLPLAGVLLAARPAAAQLELQGFMGSSLSLPSRLSIVQAGEQDLDFTAHWATRPYQDAWYYCGRIALWSGDKSWSLDFTHHKIYLTNLRPELQLFRITNGMNLVTVSRGFRRRNFSYAFGAGPVFAWPTSIVRGRRLESDRGFWGGYFLSGGHVMATVTRRFPLFAGVFFSLDSRVSVSYVRVPIAEGHASTPNFALHLHAGVGYQAGPKRHLLQARSPTRAFLLSPSHHGRTEKAE